MINTKLFLSGFYVEVKSRRNNYHLVHTESCPFLPEKENRICLGVNTEANDALGEAKSYFNKCECCIFCMKEVHSNRKELIPDKIKYANYFPLSSEIQPNNEDVMHCYAS